MKKRNRGFCWLIHHGKLLEYCYNFAQRKAFIKRNKPENEVPTRLRWMQFVKGRLPKEIWEAQRVCNKARKARDKAFRTYWSSNGSSRAERAWSKAIAADNKARDALDKALYKHKATIEALHAKEHPNCPWDGTTLDFHRKRKKKKK